MGLVLDNKLTFKKHKDKLNKACFVVGKIKRLRDIMPHDSLVTIYKSFIRPHLDYSDVIYYQSNNLKIELLLYGDSKLSATDNNLILKASIKYIMSTNRFSVPLF